MTSSYAIVRLRTVEAAERYRLGDPRGFRWGRVPLSRDQSWRWAPSLRSAIEGVGMPWRVVLPEPWPEWSISGEYEGHWSGSMLYLPEHFPDPWVAHELAHYLVCRRNLPHLLTWPDYGLTCCGDSDDQEVEAAHLTIVILRALGLPGDRWAMAQMGLDRHEEPAIREAGRHYGYNSEKMTARENSA